MIFSSKQDEYCRANFLFYVGTAKSLYNPQTNEEKDKAYAELHETFRRNSKFSVDDGIISYEKKNFFEYMLMIISNCAHIHRHEL